MRLSTIIVTWNSEEHIRDCLTSLLRNGPPDNQVIVVDNKSTDKTVEIVKAFPVFLVENPKNAGLGAATEEARKFAEGNLILVANPDITFTEDLEKLLSYADSNPKFDMIMPALEQDAKGSYHDAPPYKRHPFLLGTAFGMFLDRWFRHFLTRYSISGPRSETAYASQDNDSHSYGASCLLFKSDSLKKMGGIYQPKYFLYFADADLGKRLSKAGLKAQRYPDAMMKHFGGYSSNKLSSQARSFLNGMGEAQFEYDWGHWDRALAIWFLDTVYLVLRSKLRITKAVKDRIFFLKGWACVV